MLRGPRLAPGLKTLCHALQAASAERMQATQEERAPSDRREAARRLFDAEWQSAVDLAARIEVALEPLEALAGAGAPVPLAALVEAHRAALLAAAVGGSRNGQEPALFADEAGAALALAFEELHANAASGPDIAPTDYPDLFAALIERRAVRRRGGVDPRIHIWGALEARLQSVDRVVLGGLNEGTWPGETRADPLLSRPMREALDLQPPERRIGLAAHDFAQALGHRHVWLTRAARENGEPRVASRWLQRLMAYAGEELAETLRRHGKGVLAWARRLDATGVDDRPVRPRPSPPVELRPKRLSVTRIETLIRDPYAIYAREVLKLRPFEPLGKLPDAAERGTLIHDILEDFVRERPRGPFDAAAGERLVAIGRAAFDRYRDFPEVVALWWPRFREDRPLVRPRRGGLERYRGTPHREATAGSRSGLTSP